jgi:hypothetical protein
MTATIGDDESWRLADVLELMIAFPRTNRVANRLNGNGSVSVLMVLERGLNPTDAGMTPGYDPRL